jgi:hypothetical protein
MMTPGDDPVPPLPVTPVDVVALIKALAGGVQSVKYADRQVTYMNPGDLLKALQYVGRIAVPGSGQPRFSAACFSKGLFGYYPGGLEHAEVADIAWERRR